MHQNMKKVLGTIIIGLFIYSSNTLIESKDYHTCPLSNQIQKSLKT